MIIPFVPFLWFGPQLVKRNCIGSLSPCLISAWDVCSTCVISAVADPRLTSDKDTLATRFALSGGLGRYSKKSVSSRIWPRQACACEARNRRPKARVIRWRMCCSGRGWWIHPECLTPWFGAGVERQRNEGPSRRRQHHLVRHYSHHQSLAASRSSTTISTLSSMYANALIVVRLLWYLPAAK